ncbi:MAG TPA: M48 family metalloprotease [Egibacteraceae bacterium]
MTAPPVDAGVRRRQRVRNALQGLLLVAGMALVSGFVVWVVIGPGGLVWVAVLAMVTVLLRPRVSASVVLRMYGARQLPRSAVPDLYALVDELGRRAGVPMPIALHYVPTRMCNAFAVGHRDDPAIGVTDGLLRRLTPRELAGVLAHEVSHLASNDTKIMTLADLVSRITHGVAYAGVLLILFSLPPLMGGRASDLLLVAIAFTLVPTIITLLQLALSRTREFDADLEAVSLTGDPAGLASALVKLEQQEGRIWERILVPHRRSPDPLLLRTHPHTAERVRRLQELTVPQRQRIHVPVTLGAAHGYPPASERERLRFPGVRW